MIIIILGVLAAVSATPTDNKDSYKDQYCTDPRTMRKHAAYTEWADAYSCTRHRCQPGGRNLAIYTVGCKRVEAPESAIECEEVVEDTNMQFPFCCTRLRCLVVVRGEVWTRVLGQPWEVLPAAPWSHMYKMKKPPPSDSTFLPKTSEAGPIYELAENESETKSTNHDKVLRSGKKPPNTEWNEIVPGAAPPAPDIVIALTTGNDVKEVSRHENPRRSLPTHELKHKHSRRPNSETPAQYFEEDRESDKEKHINVEAELEELPTTSSTEKPQEVSEEKFSYANTVTPPAYKQQNEQQQVAWTEIPQNQWREPPEAMDVQKQEPSFQPQEVPQPVEVEPPQIVNEPAEKEIKENKPSNLQALVDAIGTRMRDIESVVQKMSDKVHHVKGEEGLDKKLPTDFQNANRYDMKRPSADGLNYRRFPVRDHRSSKYLHSTSDSTTEQPLFIGETNLTGYFSDPSNSVLRRNASPKEPPPTYMAPVETRRKAPIHIPVTSDTEESEKKHKKHTHKKRKSKGSHTHKKHHKDEKRKHFNRLSSGDIEKNVVSLEDSSGLGSTM